MQTMTCECAKCRAGGSTGLEAFESANFAFEEEGTFGAFEHDELTEEFDELADEAEFANEDELVDEDELPRRGGGAARSGAHPTRPKRGPMRPKLPKRGFPGRPRAPGSVEIVRPVRCVCPAFGTEYVRWVQSALNHLQGVRLPVSGVMDVATRAALRSFQQGKGLPPDGIAGPDTEQALREARRPSDPAAPPAVAQPEPAQDQGEVYEFETLDLASRPHLTGEIQKTPLRHVKEFSGPASECAAALRRAGKTKAQALNIINARIALAITMLREAASHLQHGGRSSKTRTLFRKIFRATPEFVPTWLKATDKIQDRGDVVAMRCKRVADLLASGTLKFFCAINSRNCPDCSDDASAFACSSWGDESKEPKRSRVICLGDDFWDDMKAGRSASMLATLAHEPFHIFYGKDVTVHDASRGKFGGINCIVRFVFETNGRAAPERVNERCTSMVVRNEIGLLS